MAESFYQFSATLLHHDPTLNALLFVISVFLFCFGVKRKSKFATKLIKICDQMRTA